VKEAIEGPVSDQVSASFLQEHPNASFYLDSAAAAKLTK
jgi:glucosamine-6-phosphate deaminase